MEARANPEPSKGKKNSAPRNDKKTASKTSGKHSEAILADEPMEGNPNQAQFTFKETDEGCAVIGDGAPSENSNNLYTLSC